MYLSDVDEGGHTIFPLCHAGKSFAKGSSEAEVNHTLTEGIQTLWGGPQEGFSRHVDFDYRDDHPFNDVFAAAVSIAGCLMLCSHEWPWRRAEVRVVGCEAMLPVTLSGPASGDPWSAGPPLAYPLPSALHSPGRSALEDTASASSMVPTRCRTHCSCTTACLAGCIYCRVDFRSNTQSPLCPSDA